MFESIVQLAREAIAAGGKEVVVAVLFFVFSIIVVLLFLSNNKKRDEKFLGVLMQNAENTGHINASLKTLEDISRCCKEAIEKGNRLNKENSDTLRDVRTFFRDLKEENNG